MRNFKPLSPLPAAAILLAALARTGTAAAESPAQGFALERLYLSAPGNGWFVMDELTMHGGLGGALALTTGYARNPLRVGSGSERVPVVSHQLFSDFGFAATVDRFRLSLNLEAPISSKGRSGTVDGYSFTAPNLTLSSSPDSFADARIGAEARVLGNATAPFRLGIAAQLFFPTGKRLDYDSDGTYRAMGRALVAGDIGAWSYAGQLGAHLRPLHESMAADSARGSELLFGAAGGLKFLLRGSASTVLVVGPEVFGETAFDSFFASRSTGAEALLTARLETFTDRGALLRVKLGAGGGIDPHFGAPEWRAVCAIELSAQSKPDERR